MGMRRAIKRGLRFKEAYDRWNSAKGQWDKTPSITADHKDRPIRTPEEIQRIYAICERCEDFQENKEGWGRCKLCGCRLNLTGKLNKIKMATEGCPADSPKWDSLIILKEDNVKMSSKEETRKARAERIRRREERIARRKKREESMPKQIELPPNTDELYVTDRDGHAIGHCMRNFWAPSAGFLVGGGPSLKELDLSPLKERGIVSLGINNAAAFAPVRAFTCGDPPEKFHHGIFFDGAMLKFVPIHKLKKRVRAKTSDGKFAFTSFRVRDCPSVFGYQRDSEWKPEEFFSRQQATWGRGDKQAKEADKPHILFSFFLGLRLMHYLGCQHVYLLGVDFAMDDTHGYAFDQERAAGAIRGNNNSYRLAVDMCKELVPTFRDVGFGVYNCNRESRLDVFPYVSYERALEDCRGMVPKEPLDLHGWYEKPGDEEDKRTDG